MFEIGGLKDMEVLKNEWERECRENAPGVQGDPVRNASGIPLKPVYSPLDLGNVFEWCEDVHDEDAYRHHERNNPLN
jgi:hypothetical protein